MPSTLLISGSLADQPVRALLESASAGRIDVVEFDSLLDQTQFPAVHRWSAMTGLMETADREAIDATVKSWTDFLFSQPAPTPDFPSSREFRVASFGVAELVCLMTAAINLRIGAKLLDAGNYEKIVVGAGCGVNFTIWKQLAAERGLPVDFLPVQSHRRTLWRRLVKWHYRSKQKRPATTAVAMSVDQLPQGLQVLCASRAVGDILLKQGDPSSQGIAVVDAKDLVRADPKELARLRSAYSAWNDDAAQFGPGAGKIVAEIGRNLARDTYPLRACIYDRALRVLKDIRPRALLCDTQRGSPERMWALAARDLGIPTMAYTYDHLLERNYFFIADHLVSDSGRNTLNAIKQGVPPENIVEALSHRLPKIRRVAGEGTLVVCSDNFYSGDQCTQDPQVSYHLYRAAVAAAREMPETRFILKFHPLRQRKSELRSFTGMDEQELANRKRYIRDLDPPPNFRTLDPEAPILTVLEKADALVNIESMTGVEAFRLGIPVVFLRLPIEQDFPMLTAYDAACFPGEGETLADKLKLVLRDEAFRNQLVAHQQRYAEELYWRSTTPLAIAATSHLKRNT